MMLQNFWRCAHYPSALENFAYARTMCEWGCHTQELRWYHSGTHPMPKSWGTPFGAKHQYRCRVDRVASRRVLIF